MVKSWKTSTFSSPSPQRWLLGWSGWTVAAYFREADTDFDDPATSDIKDRFYGLGATYDLGGGLLLAGGVAVWDFDDLPSEYVVGDFGISFNF